jgi:integrase
VKPRTGYVYKDKLTDKWYARIGYTKNNGRRSSIKRKVESKSEGRRVLRQLLATFEEGGSKAVQAEKLTFGNLCDYYAEHYMIAAQYSNGRKIAGLRSVTSVRGYVKVLREHFGRRLLKSMTYEDLRTYRAKRLKGGTHQSAQRSIATVNRELSYLRRLLNIAVSNDWITKNPFTCGDALIHAADERQRERVLTSSECQRLVDACTGRRAHLRAIVIAGLDTGCRMREILKLRWKDVDLQEGVLTIQAFNTKTLRKRQVAITGRLDVELSKLGNESPADPQSFLFGGIMDIRRAFRRACKDAELDESGKERITFHHLRHCHAVRLDNLGFSLAKIGAQLGHVVLQTTLRYASHSDRQTVRAVGIALTEEHAERHAHVLNAELVN